MQVGIISSELEQLWTAEGRVLSRAESQRLADLQGLGLRTEKVAELRHAAAHRTEALAEKVDRPARDAEEPSPGREGWKVGDTVPETVL